MKLPIASYTVSAGREFGQDGHVATTTQLFLRVQGGTHLSGGQRITEVQVTFGKPSGDTIGNIEFDTSSTATVVATVPLAEFETCWAILHDGRPYHVYCGVDTDGKTLGFFNLATEGFPAPVHA
jgi:hypothetical protein